MISAGVPQAVAMEITGRTTPSMFAGYNIVVTSDMARGFEQMATASRSEKKASGGSLAVMPVKGQK